MEERAAWLYDETRQIGTDYESRDEVERYDERMSRLRDFDAELDEIAEMTGLAAGQTLIEYGCGTGRIAREAARRCGRVIAIDISPAMLARAEDRARAEGIDNMTFVQSGFSITATRGRRRTSRCHSSRFTTFPTSGSWWR